MLYRSFASLLYLFYACAHANDRMSFSNVIPIERNDLSLKIKEGLLKNHIVILEGFGGIGKSHLVQHYIKTQTQIGKDPKNRVCWIDCRSPIFDQLKNFIRSANNIFNDENLLEAVNENILLEKIQLCAQKKNITLLIVFDSLDNANLANEIIPMVSTYKLDCLITTRLSLSSPFTLKIPPFTEDQARDYLCKNLPFYSHEKIERLSNFLKSYPLSLSQATHFLLNHPSVSIDTYIQHHQKDTPSHTFRQQQFSVEKEPYAIENIVKHSLEQVLKENMLAERMLTFFTQINNKDIQLSFIRDVFENMGFSRKEIHDALLHLKTYNLISVEHDDLSRCSHFSMHEIIQDTLFHLLDSAKMEHMKTTLAAYFKKILYAHRNNIIHFANEHTILLSHMLTFSMSKKESTECTENELTLQIFLLDYWVYVKRNHQNALLLIDTIEQHMEILKEPRVKARFLSTAGDVLSLQRLGAPQTNTIFEQMKEQLADYIYALAKLDRYEVIRLQNSIGQNLLLQSKASEAKEYILLSLEMIQKMNEPVVQIPTLYFAAWVYIDCGEFEHALDCLNQSIRLFDKTPSTAIKFYTLNFKAFSLLNLKCYKDAFEAASTSIDICTSYFGSFPSDALAEAMVYQAESALRIQDPEYALEIIERALATFRSFYKGDDKMIDQAYAWLVKGDCFLMQEKFTEAQRSYVKSSLIVDTLKASKSSRFYKKLLKRLIFSSIQNGQLNISERYIAIYNRLFKDDKKYHFNFKNISAKEFFERF